MPRYVTSDDVRELVSRLKGAPDGFEKERINSRLDDIVDGDRFEGRVIEFESGVDADEIRSMLAGYGSRSVYEYMYGD